MSAMNRTMTILAAALLTWACSDTPADPAPATSGFQPGTAGSGGDPGGNGSGAGAGVGGSGGTASAGDGGAAGASTAGAGGSDAAGSGGAAGSGTGGAGAAGTAGTAGVEVPAGCEVPAKEDEFYALSAESLEQFDPIPMCSYRGKVVMVVNVASKCGYTPQYAPLQQIFDKYKEQGFVVLGFPSAQFDNQEFADDKDISEFCTETYGITFPMFTRIDVNGAKQHPVYAWLKAQPGGAGSIPWNFTKFLLGRDGKLIKHIKPETKPDAPEVLKLIEEALAVTP
jgi:glutathione peroxidase